MYVFVYLCVVCVCVCTCLCKYLCVVCVCVYVWCVFVCVYVWCMCGVCMCVYVCTWVLIFKKEFNAIIVFIQQRTLYFLHYLSYWKFLTVFGTNVLFGEALLHRYFLL